MRIYRSGPHSTFGLKVYLVWIPKYGKPVLVGPVTLRVRDLLREAAMGHVHLLIAYPPQQVVS